jgi:hypothetical protein
MDPLPWNIYGRNFSENMSHMLFFVVLIYVSKKKWNNPDLTEHKVDTKEQMVVVNIY